ncbi:subtype B tannase [Lonepinella sp. BR2271]|uniref:subtype B tannase n=1 Tax=Lonepinella sp. BR2271 TaxID=3434550 RepID=UPI003F6E3C0F
MKLSKISTALFAGSLVAGSLATQVFAAPPAQKNPLADLPYANKTDKGYNLEFDGTHYTTATATVNGKDIIYRAYEKIVYVANPVEPDYQTLNFYVPEEYYQGKDINGYNAKTAPIFLPNAIGGYMPAMAAAASQAGHGGKTSTILQALERGYVVASVGARGRTLKQGDTYTGKAPTVIVDLKSAVRYLHANDANMPGDANKIISNGTSAGGAMSALLGASGDSADYNRLLKEIGAVNASDAIFAVSAYCPITNLEHADAAYEWEFNGLHQYSRMDMSKLDAKSFNDRSMKQAVVEGELTADQINISDQLKAQFPDYLNSLQLKDSDGQALTLDKAGNGTFRHYVENALVQSANQALTGLTEEEKKAFMAKYKGLSYSNENVSTVNLAEFVTNKKRMKSPPAFDALDLSSGENDEFGTATVQALHFTPYSLKHSTVNGGMADAENIKLLNAMNYTDNSKAAPHWRIRVGAEDYDTSHAISAMLAVKLRMSGKNVDYALPWGVGHAGDYDLAELFDWIDGIAK